MRGIYIWAGVALALFLLLQVRLGGRVEYSQRGLEVCLRLGVLRIRVFPLPVKRTKKKAAHKPIPTKPQQVEPAPEPELGISFPVGGALDYIRRLLPLVLQAAGRMWGAIRVDKLRMELTAGAKDPVDAAMLYGRANAALGALWQPIIRVFHVKDGAARVKLDYEAQGMTLYGEMALSVKIGQILWLGIFFGIKGLKCVLSIRKEQKMKQQQRKAA